MTKEEMELLADIIVDRLIEKQKEYDKQFKAEVESIVSEYNHIIEDKDPFSEFKENIKQLKILELEKELKKYLDNEDYIKASKIKKDIDNLRAL
jgi:protein-arginine kinase activator protein McsA